nr:reverse transcriptase domain-containing protein [Tanacetum cinerariifolium]
MSTNEKTPLSQPTFSVRNALGKEQDPQDFGRPASDAALREYCNKNYHQLLTIIAKKVHQEKVQQERLKAVKARLNFEETSQHYESGILSGRRDLKKRLGPRHARSMSESPEPRHRHFKSPRKRDPERKTVFKRLEKGVFHRLRDKGKSMSAYSNYSRRRSYHSSRRDTESCYRSSRSRETKFAFEKRHDKRASSRRTKSLSESEESIDSYNDLKEAFLENYLQQKKCVKDPVEIHNIKQRDGESTKEFVRRKAVTSNQRIKAKQWKRLGKGDKKGRNLKKGKTAGNIDGEEDGMEGLMIIEVEMGGRFVHHMYMDRVSSSEILYKHCFNKFCLEVKSQMILATTLLVGFSGEIKWPIGQILLLVKIDDEDPSTSEWMNFMVVRMSTHQTKENRVAPERNKATYEEVKKLVDAGIMKEVHYHSCLSNPLMVKNHDDSWRMCVDFKDLNKAFLKDGYPLSEIDWKVEAVLSFPSPKCLKDVQKLNGKLASLNRFLSKSSKKSLPFFKTLKKCTKESDFQWTVEAKTTFKQMKKSIAELPMLTAPKEKEELIIYLAAAKEAISAVLMTEIDGKQMPIYFVSRTLQGPKINYTPMEKLILALVSASKRLKKILANFIVERPEDDPQDTAMGDEETLLDPWILKEM